MPLGSFVTAIMSIDFEALRTFPFPSIANLYHFVEDAHQGASPQDNNLSGEVSKVVDTKEETPAGKKKTWIIVLVAILGLLLIVFLGVFLKDVFTGLTVLKQKILGQKNFSFSSKKYSQDNYLLEGVIYDEGVALAIINGQVLREGDILDNLEVRSIMPRSVQLIDKESDTTITLSF